MVKSKMISIVVLFFVLTIQAKESMAKCAGLEPFYCKSIKFENKIESGNSKLFENQAFYCQEKITLQADNGNKNVNVIFSERGECPEAGSNILGTLLPLCQDTGRWTDADYVLLLKSQEDCAITHSDRLKEVEGRAAKITLGMKSVEVEKIFPDPDRYQWGEQKSVVYYEHPEVLIEVPYDENYVVNGEIKIYKGSASGRGFTPWYPR